jgi:hypothetical protein
MNWIPVCRLGNKSVFEQECAEGTEMSPFSLRTPVQIHRQDSIAILAFGYSAFDDATVISHPLPF